MTTGRGRSRTNPTGSSRAAWSVSGLSRLSKIPPLVTCLARVVLPDWRGPNSAVTRNVRKNERSTGSMRRRMMPESFTSNPVAALLPRGSDRGNEAPTPLGVC